MTQPMVEAGRKTGTSKPPTAGFRLNAGVPPYELSEVGTPSDVKMNGLTAAEFGRFAVAYGLSVPSGEGPDIGLPSEFSYTEPPRVRQHANVVDYLDSKDVYE